MTATLMGRLGRAGTVAAEHLAQERLTVLGLVLLVSTLLAMPLVRDAASWMLAAPLILLAANLAAVLVVGSAFRKRTALLVFHLALLWLLVFAAIGQLCRLRGTAEVTVGGEFGGLLTREAGPLHAGRIDRVQFVNEGLAIDYLAGARRDQLRNRVRWTDESGVVRSDVIGDNQPLVLHGYRFYATANKGFAPVYVWQPKHGAALRGSIHLPSWPAHDTRQWLDWTLPGSGIALWTRLDFDETLLRDDAPSRFRVPTRYELVMRRGDARWTMRPGEAINLPEGRLEFQGLELWMGYEVFYDWTLPWLLAAGLVAAGSLGMHVLHRHFRAPWTPQ